MIKDTNMDKIKDVAKTSLSLPPEPTEFTPLVVKHPFTDSSFAAVDLGNGLQLSDITQDFNALQKWRAQMRDLIENADSPRCIYMAITKSYRFAFLRHTMQYLSRTDFSEMLAEAWIMCEAPNSDPNFTKQELVGLFKKADPHFLMTEEENEQLKNFDDTVTVWRGLTEYNADQIKALSWTLKRETAEWFANRFDEGGKVYEAQIDKEHILALFIGRNESEVIVDPKYLMNITEVEDITSDFHLTM